MNIKQAYDEMIDAKINLDREIANLILEMEGLSPEEAIKEINRFKGLTDEVVSPFTGGERK